MYTRRIYSNLVVNKVLIQNCACISLMFQIELYNSVVDKEGTDSERQAMEAYKAAREESDRPAKVAGQVSVSSALIDKVNSQTDLHSSLCS